MSTKKNKTLFTRKSSRSPISQKQAMRMANEEINKAKPLASKAATEKRDANIIYKYLRMSRGKASKLNVGRGN